MTASPVQDQSTQTPENKPNDKELNFRALEAKYQRQLEQERNARLEAERIAQEAVAKKQQVQEDDDEDGNEPYVDHKRLNKKLAKFGQNTQSEFQKAIDQAKRDAKEEIRQETWLEKNKDFHEVMQNAQKLYEKDQELAEAILRMPDSFERQKLVYKNIKALGLDKPEAKQPSIQEKIDSNKRSPYYQPSGVGAAPYAAAGDYSPSGQKNAYQKMQELKNKLRI